jgi:hypothetical protein
MKKIAKENYFELAQFLMDYHSGQWSRGYRVLYRLEVSGNWSSQLSEQLRDTDLYQYLVSRYADKV